MSDSIATLAPQLARIDVEPYYQPIADEVALFEAACARRLPVLLKGPTGCGKTRFVEYMAWRLRRPLATVACHDDLTTADLVGRYLIVGDETVWVDGPLTAAVRAGAICYLDEPSTRQRFVALEFAYPEAAVEAGIVAREGGVDAETAQRLVKLAELTRNLKGAGLDEGASTRLLVHAAQLIAAGIAPPVACTAAVARALSDDPDMAGTLDDLVAAVF